MTRRLSEKVTANAEILHQIGVCRGGRRRDGENQQIRADARQKNTERLPGVYCLNTIHRRRFNSPAHCPYLVGPTSIPSNGEDGSGNDRLEGRAIRGGLDDAAVNPVWVLVIWHVQEPESLPFQAELTQVFSAEDQLASSNGWIRIVDR